MTCPGCGYANPARAKFCLECGGSFAPRCGSCGTELPASAKFCLECGTRVGEPSARTADGARKIVTIVFADLVGSTALHERLDPESARRFMERYYAATRAAVEAHGGRVTQLLGDGVKAVFGVPRVAEDDAIRAVCAAVAMQEAFRALAESERAAVGKTGLRVAVNTGEVVVSEAAEIIGDPVNVAARLQEQGRDGDVVIGEATQRLVAAHVTLERLGAFALKGRSEEVTAYRVVSLEPPAGAGTAPFVGRDVELARLEAVWTAAVSAPSARLAVVLGSPGVGKSRLIAEVLRRRADQATVVATHCDAAGGATFAPLVDPLRRLLRLDDAADDEGVRAAVATALPAVDEGEHARIAAGVTGLLGGAATSPEEIFFVVRRLLAGLAAARPVVLVIDDLQWAEPLLLDLVEHLIQWGGGAPLLVLIGARPELRDVRSALASAGGAVAELVALGGLDAGAAMRLAANVIGADDLPAGVAARVLAASEGNPLFVGELVRMLVREGALQREGDRWIVGEGLAALAMPPTIQALLAARIERLDAEERIVLERAAVIGRHFSRHAVAELVGIDAGDLAARLETLRRSELVERDTGWYLGEPAWRFHHALIRDAAYRRLLKGTRAELHARVADWIMARAGETSEQDETVGWHLEQAHQHLRELGPLEVAGRALGERAARHLAAAGRRALARDDLALAAGLLGRALACLDAADPARAGLALDWCEALLAAGSVGPAAAAIAELGRFVGDSERLHAWHACFTGQLTALSAPEALTATLDAVETAAERLATLGDAAGEAKAHAVHAQALARLGQVGAAEAALDRALAAARRAGDRRRANAVLAGAPVAALWGPSPVTRASGRCLDVVRVLRITQGAPGVEAVALSCQGVLEALRGRTEAARRMIASSRQMVEELGIAHRILEADVFAGRIDLLEGDAASAERVLRTGYEGLRELGLGIAAARAGALLGRALLALGRAAEAEALSRESERLAGDDLQAAIAWRGVRAEALAGRGEHAAAIALAEAAVAIAASTDALLDHADARLALAAALRAAGRIVEADAEERRATELWEAKGATLLAERARPVDRRDTSPSRGVAAPPVQRRLRANAAVAVGARVEAAFRARDLDAVAGLWTEDLEVVDHLHGATYGRAGELESGRRMMRAPGLDIRLEPLATLGESLCLARRTVVAAGQGGGRFDVGDYEMEHILLCESRDGARSCRFEVFAADRLGHAIARLYERWAESLPEGPGRARADTAARAVAYMLTPGNEASDVSTFFAASYEDVDHRSVGYGSLSGDDLGRLVPSLHEVADRLSFRIDDVLVLEPDGLVRTTVTSGVWRDGGGAFERAVCAVTMLGSDGRVERHETFDADQAAEALARFDALTDSRERAGRRVGLVLGERECFANAAARAFTTFARAWRVRDWEGVRATYHASHRMDDRRRLMRMEVAGDTFFANERLLFDDTASDWRGELLATRGERLALLRVRFTATVAGSGPMEVEVLDLVEVDGEGRRTALVVFDPDDTAAGFAELEGRWRVHEEGECPLVAAYQAAFDRALAARDWDALAALYAPGFVAYDHRLVGWERVEGGVALAGTLRAMVELAPDVRARPDHLRSSTHGRLGEVVWIGTRDGGVFEVPFVHVVELDAQGRVARLDFYDPTHRDDARARFAAIDGAASGSGIATPAAATRSAPLAPDPTRIPPNAATRASDRRAAAFAARDWEGFRALCAPSLVFEDRRWTARTTGDREMFLASNRLVAERGVGAVRTVQATAGEHLALEYVRFTGGDGGAEFEVETLRVTEVDDDGLLVRIVFFDPEDREAANEELIERSAASFPEAHPGVLAIGIAFMRAFSAHDPEAIRRLLPPDFYLDDRRRTGVGRLEGRDAYVDSLRALWQLSPDIRFEQLYLVVRAAHGAVVVHRWFGTNEAGGDIGAVFATMTLVRDGALRGIEIFEITDADAACARLAALAFTA